MNNIPDDGTRVRLTHVEGWPYGEVQGEPEDHDQPDWLSEGATVLVLLDDGSNELVNPTRVHIHNLVPEDTPHPDELALTVDLPDLP